MRKENSLLFSISCLIATATTVCAESQSSTAGTTGAGHSGNRIINYPAPGSGVDDALKAGPKFETKGFDEYMNQKNKEKPGNGNSDSCSSCYTIKITCPLSPLTPSDSDCKEEDKEYCIVIKCEF